MVNQIRTAEVVTPKHPDKMCDQISDAVLDWALRRDPNARVAIETLGGHGRVFIAGELTMKHMPEDEDFEAMLEDIVERVTGEKQELDWAVDTQSPDIAKGVDTGGAGDQGIMIGYACNENEAMIPQELYLARNLAQFIYAEHPVDGKTQITLNADGTLAAIVASFQKTTAAQLDELIKKWLTDKKLEPKNCVIFTNPAGDWEQGGFDADTGLTGRKIAVDNYGPQIPIGGGAFSGKDASKVDRSGAYKARQVAVQLLKEKKASEVMVKVAYAIGVVQPVMATAEIAYPDGKNELIDLLAKPSNYTFDFSPLGIIQSLDLRKPLFEATAMWGHHGNDFRWDK